MHCKLNFQLLKFNLIWALSRENLTLMHANNKGEDQPARPLVLGIEQEIIIDYRNTLAD